MSNHYRVAAKVALIYAVIAAAWIQFSDAMLMAVATDVTTITKLQTMKGGFFVVITAIILFWLVAVNTRDIGESRRQLQFKNKELTQANAEIQAVEEELRQQFDELLANQDRIRRQNECLSVLKDTASAIMHELDVNELLRLIVEKTAAMCRSNHAYLYTLSDDGQTMEMRVRAGATIQELGFRQVKGQGVVGRVWETGRLLIIRDYQQWPDRVPGAPFDAIRTSTGFPLVEGDRVIGVFGVNYFEDHFVDEAEISMLSSFAELAAIALGNARLHTHLQEELRERLKVEALLRKNQAHLQAVFDALPDSIFRFGRDGILREYKRGSDISAHQDYGEYVGRHLRDFIEPAVASKIIRSAELALVARTTQQFEYENGAREGRRFFYEIRIVPCGSDEFLGLVRNITDQKQLERELKRITLVDQATGLYNRTYFETVLSRMADPRYLPVGVIVCDIDGLKFVNDTLGHAAGDELILAAAGMIAARFGDGDIVARIGGGEFAVIMPNRETEDVAEACRRIRDDVEQYRELSKMPLSLSIGMASRAEKDEEPGEILKAADRNMHREKLHSRQSGHSAIVATLAKALEARDFVTDGHADRLQEYVEALAQAAGMPESTLPDLRLFGRFHDIGKVGIPDSILFKPGPLTDEEYETMKKHCEIGHRIAKASPELAPIADWILKHQEWWNGQGYPLGLAGEDIPIPCRILAIVDAYDAMTNDRPYRAAMSHKAAIEEVLRCAGRQFDPDLAKLFVSIADSRNRE